MKTNTEKSIEFLNDCQDDYEELQEEGNNKGILEVIRLLQRGEKFEKMWGNFKTINREYFSNFEVRANYIIRMEELEQKYFPKPKTTKGKINDIMTKLRDLDIHPRGEIIKMLIELRDEEEIK